MLRYPFLHKKKSVRPVGLTDFQFINIFQRYTLSRGGGC